MVTTPTGKPAWSRKADIADYGGSLNKLGAGEADEPYAGTLYREFQSMRGSAYTRERNTLVHAENLALARFFAHVGWRVPEKFRANLTPARASDKLSYWVDVLGVSTRPEDNEGDIRLSCSANFQIAKGNSYIAVLDAVKALLGTKFVAILLSRGTDLANPPLNTFWPGVNPGPGSYSLGGGAWTSERSHVAIQVTKPADSELGDFIELMDGKLIPLLDSILPDHVTTSWVTGDGFLLDISQLDFDGLGP